MSNYFITFINCFEQKLKEKLPGDSAQSKMAPVPQKVRDAFYLADPSPKKSAVLILFFPFEEGVGTLLIKRQSYKGVHSGQICFPGGKVDPDDVDLPATALRETNEETGIIAKDVMIIGKISDLYIPASRFHVTSIVGYINYFPEFIPNPREVEKIIPVNLKSLSDEKIISTREFTVGENLVINAPVYLLNEYVIWGATAMMIAELNEIVREI